MQEPNLFGIYSGILNKNKISYFVSGSVASIIYGQPRLTHDIDLIIHLKADEIDTFIKAFPLDQFYCPPEETIRIELNRSIRGHFNLIHHETGFKADIYFTGSDELQLWAMNNKKHFDFPGYSLYVAPPEYVIIKKLEYYREGRSQKHILDIQGIIANSNEIIDYEFLNKKISEYKLEEYWNQVH